MTHKRKDTYAKPKEWAKHLRPDGKRRMAKAERIAAKHIVEETVEEAKTENTPLIPEESVKQVNKKRKKKYKLLAIARPEFLEECKNGNSIFGQYSWYEKPTVLGKFKDLKSAEQSKSYHETEPYHFYNPKKFTFEIKECNK